jgi:hypothetical protein
MSPAVIAGKVSNFTSPDGCRISVINQEANELYFGGNGIGAAVIDAAGRRAAVIGVVRSLLLRTAQRRVEPAIYFPMTEDDFLPLMTLTLQTRRADDATVTSVRTALDGIPGGGQPGADTRAASEQDRARAGAIATVLVGHQRPLRWHRGAGT